MNSFEIITIYDINIVSNCRITLHQGQTDPGLGVGMTTGEVSLDLKSAERALKIIDEVREEVS